MLPDVSNCGIGECTCLIFGKICSLCSLTHLHKEGSARTLPLLVHRHGNKRGNGFAVPLYDVTVAFHFNFMQKLAKPTTSGESRNLFINDTCIHGAIIANSANIVKW